MKREVTRSRRLPAFRIDLAVLETLVDRLASLFPMKELYQLHTIKLDNEEIKFKTVDEVRNCSDLPFIVTSFGLYLSEGGRTIHIRTGFMGGSVEISATAENAAWCAGAVETTYAFLRNYRRWYWWFRGWPIGLLAFGSLNLYGLLILLHLR